MRIVGVILAVAGNLLAVLLFLPVSPVAPRPPAPATGPAPERLAEFRREVDQVEAQFNDAETECGCRVDAEEVMARLLDSAQALQLRAVSIAKRQQRAKATGALSFDVSMRGDFPGLRTLLGQFEQWKKLVLVRDLRIRSDGTELTASFILVVMDRPTQFVTAVVNRPD